jgi:hypothetical protein
MALINSIEILKQYVRVNFTNSTSKMPDIAGTENRYIKPILGNAIYSNMQSLADANNTSNALLKLVRAAIAPLAYYKDLAVIHLQIGDNGLGTFISENVKSANRWEFNTAKDYFAEEGAVALEILLQYLYDNKEDLEWDIPNNYNQVFLTGKDFSLYFPLYQPYRTFELLRTVSKIATDEFIIPNIGEDFYKELLAITYSEDAVILKKQKTAITLLKKATAFQTIKLACEILPVKFSGNGFTVLLAGYGSDSVTPSENTAADNQIVGIKQNCITSADTNMQLLVAFLNENATDSLFDTYKNSSLYKSPTTEKPTSINQDTKSFFF